MAYTNSPLVSYTKISPNRTKNRKHAIDTITIHCVVGQCTVERLGEIFAPESRQASSNYGVGKDGRIGMYCEEKDRSWCTSNATNDHRAITIEVASDTSEPYAVNDKAFAGLLDLVTDICKRNGIKKLVWSTKKNERVNHLNGCNMTVHRDYANKSCPGTYLYDRHGKIAEEVNKRLGATTEVVTPEPEDTPVTKPTEVKIGDIVTFTGKYHYASANSTNAVSARSGKAKVTAIYPKGKHPYHLIREKGGTSNVYGWVDAKDIWELGTTEETSKVPYLVKVTTSALNIRKGAGTSYAVVGCIKDRGVYTIVEEKNGWGKLKSGAGWISLQYTKKV